MAATTDSSFKFAWGLQRFSLRDFESIFFRNYLVASASWGNCAVTLEALQKDLAQWSTSRVLLYKRYFMYKYYH